VKIRTVTSPARRLGLAVASLTAVVGVALSPAVTAHAALATDGTPDTSFTAAAGTGFNASVDGIVVQSTGKIIAWGAFTQLNSAAVTGIARLSSTGAPDTAFTTALGTGLNDGVRAAAVYTNASDTARLDKVLIGGRFTSVNGVTVNRFARLNADGTPDTTFNTALGTAFDDQVRAIAIQPDNKILVGGAFTTYQGTPVNKIMRLNADLTIDTTFATNLGTGVNDAVNQITLQDDGKILVAGAFTQLNSVAVGYFARLNANGTPDTTFNTALGAGFDSGAIEDITVLDDDRIIVAGGFTQLNAVNVPSIVRLSSAGARDAAFEGPFGSGLTGAVWEVLEQYDGSLVIGGSFNAVASRNVVRLKSNLTWDAAFATNQGTGFNDEVYALAFQTGGALVVGGYFDKLNEATSNRIARLLNNDVKPGLPPAGANTGVLVLLGVVLLGAGMTVIGVSARRRRTIAA